MRQKAIVRAVALALALPIGAAWAAPTPRIKPDSMLMVDMNRGAIIDGTSISDAPALKIECSGGSRAAPTGCFYFHQEGTLFVNARSSGYAVMIGKPDFSDAHNSIKIDHLIVNNNSSVFNWRRRNRKNIVSRNVSHW